MQSEKINVMNFTNEKGSYLSLHHIIARLSDRIDQNLPVNPVVLNHNNAIRERGHCVDHTVKVFERLLQHVVAVRRCHTRDFELRILHYITLISKY